MKVLDRWRSSTDAARFEAYTWWSIAVLLWIVPFFAFGSSVAATEGVTVAESDAPVPLTRTWTIVVLVGAGVLHALADVRAARESWSVRLGRGTSSATTLVLLVATTALLVVAAVLVVPTSEDPLSDGDFVVVVAITAALASYGARWSFRTLALAVLPAAALSGVVRLLSDASAGREALVVLVADGLVIFGFGASIWLSAWMVEVVRRLEQSREVEGRLAVAEERLRFSRDLHDTVGRSLSAIAVKSELAAELARRGRGEAAEEMTSVRDLAHDALAEVRTVAAGYRAVNLTDELEGARSLLRSTGAVTTMTGDVDGVGPVAQDVLAWVVREGVTNVVRHSSAREVTLTLAREDGDAVLTLVNDGATLGADEADTDGATPHGTAADGRRGSGLAGLEERLARVGGRLTTERDGERFVLVARVPADAAGRQGSPAEAASSAASAPSPEPGATDGADPATGAAAGAAPPAAPPSTTTEVAR
ncbi:sensor histidine kinase [Georgenia sp. Z1344]|uniref:sensor histidine kinase n=1 Tax=Georgenia sp. Z1344 TaxID=3416706 RepID=UPI003CEB0D91